MKFEILLTGNNKRLPKTLSSYLKCPIDIIINKGDINTKGPFKGKECSYYICYVEVTHDNIKKVFEKLKKKNIEFEQVVVNLTKDYYDFDEGFLNILTNNKVSLEVNKFKTKKLKL